MFPQKSPFCPLFGPFYSHFAIPSAGRAAGASRSPAPKERVWPRSLQGRRSGPNRVRPDQPRVNLAALRTVKFLPAFLTGLIDKSCAIRMSSGQVSSCPRADTRAPPFGVDDTIPTSLVYDAELSKTTIPASSLVANLNRRLRGSFCRRRQWGAEDLS